MAPKDLAKITSSKGVFWITGLSGAGKSTLANEIFRQIKENGFSAILLDGDVLREVFAIDYRDPENFTRASRVNLALRYSRLCKILSSQVDYVVIGTISMFNEVYNWNRKHIPNYFEVYLKVGIQELIRRDSKGLYSKYINGEIKNLAGLDLEIDEPNAPDYLVLNGSEVELKILAESILIKQKELS
jgi:cytidine diphosphoramidate kinase